MSLLSGPTGPYRFSPPPTYPHADGCVSTSPTAACAGRTCLFFDARADDRACAGPRILRHHQRTRVRCRRLVGRRQRGGAAHRRVRRVPRVPAGRRHRRLRNAGLTRGPGLGRAGALAESVVVPADAVRGARQSGPDRSPQPLAVTLRGVWHSGAQAGDSVVVMGAGPIRAAGDAGAACPRNHRCACGGTEPDRRQLARTIRVAATAPDDLFAQAAQLAGPVRANARLMPVMRRCSRTR